MHANSVSLTLIHTYSHRHTGFCLQCTQIYTYLLCVDKQRQSQKATMEGGNHVSQFVCCASQQCPRQLDKWPFAKQDWIPGRQLLVPTCDHTPEAIVTSTGFPCKSRWEGEVTHVTWLEEPVILLILLQGMQIPKHLNANLAIQWIQQIHCIEHNPKKEKEEEKQQQQHTIGRDLPRHQNIFLNFF